MPQVETFEYTMYGTADMSAIHVYKRGRGTIHKFPVTKKYIAIRCSDGTVVAFTPCGNTWSARTVRDDGINQFRIHFFEPGRGQGTGDYVEMSGPLEWFMSSESDSWSLGL